MKGVGFWMGAVCAMLLLVSFAIADHVTGIPQGQYISGGSQRILEDEYRNWFYELPQPEAQRILNPAGLDVRRGDLATPAVLGAERVLDPTLAWRYGYDIGSGMPILSPRGEKRVLKSDFGYGDTAVGELPMVPLRERTLSFRQAQSMRMAQYLARKTKQLPIKRMRARIPTQPVESLEDLDFRPVFLTEYERQQGFKDLHSNTMLRARFLATMPGTAFSEIQPMIGSGQLTSGDLAKLSFMTRRPGQIQGDVAGSSSYPIMDYQMDSSIIARNKFLGDAPGLIQYGGK